jgi:Uma2 family endonuclease
MQKNYLEKEMTITQAISPKELRRLEREAGVEFVDGKLLVKPVNIEACGIEATIGSLLGNEAARSRTACVYSSSLGYRCFAGDLARIRKPNASVVRVERMKGIDTRETYMPIPPDLAVEVISPNDLATELAMRIEEYLNNGFPLVWVVAPATKTVTTHRADGSVSRLHAKDEITGETALPTFRCKVAEFFESIPAIA